MSSDFFLLFISSEHPSSGCQRDFTTHSSDPQSLLHLWCPCGTPPDRCVQTCNMYARRLSLPLGDGAIVSASTRRSFHLAVWCNAFRGASVKAAITFLPYPSVPSPHDALQNLPSRRCTSLTGGRRARSRFNAVPTTASGHQERPSR